MAGTLPLFAELRTPQPLAVISQTDFSAGELHVQERVAFYLNHSPILAIRLKHKLLHDSLLTSELSSPYHIVPAPESFVLPEFSKDSVLVSQGVLMQVSPEFLERAELGEAFLVVFHIASLAQSEAFCVRWTALDVVVLPNHAQHAQCSARVILHHNMGQFAIGGWDRSRAVWLHALQLILPPDCINVLR